MIVLIDNYDSFTYNLYQYIGKYNKDILVYRNDEITLDELDKLQIEGIIISPGPKTPYEAGITLPIIKKYYNKIPILGICLGHEAIGVAFGGKLNHSKKIMHGKTSKIKLNDDKLFSNMPDEIKVARYHSLIVEDLPDELEILTMGDNEIMGIKHRDYDVYGLQFHPESILTQCGDEIIANFINLCR
ncbi:aminodeoxychorismate/anthranilate synthase component II [Fusobacterium sp. IOR10]|uniref:anthranilate synthase component II n=1 Tax=Fusobacterium sp. IOR10 TaxID=2665157 RepID=UPI0013CF85A3|nr:aminodeoxychorismate/anthranilate synthase component II [Fusobacterium sp. IOR10]